MGPKKKTIVGLFSIQSSLAPNGVCYTYKQNVGNIISLGDTVVKIIVIVTSKNNINIICHTYLLIFRNVFIFYFWEFI